MVHDLASAAVGEPAAGEDCLYSERDLYALAEASLARSAGMCCAVAVISLGGFRQIYEGGESFAAKVRSLTLSLQSALGFRCVMARQAPDRFLVFFPGPIDQVRLRARMESAFSFVRLVLAGNVKLDEMRFVAGASVEPCRTANVSAMAAQVGGLCRAWKDAPVDTVVFPHEEDVREWPELARNEDRDCVTVHHEEMGRSLSENEKDIAFRCVSSMLSADSLETSPAKRAQLHWHVLPRRSRVSSLAVCRAADPFHAVRVGFSCQAQHSAGRVGRAALALSAAAALLEGAGARVSHAHAAHFPAGGAGLRRAMVLYGVPACGAGGGQRIPLRGKCKRTSGGCRAVQHADSLYPA